MSKVTFESIRKIRGLDTTTKAILESSNRVCLMSSNKTSALLRSRGRNGVAHQRSNNSITAGLPLNHRQQQPKRGILSAHAPIIAFVLILIVGTIYELSPASVARVAAKHVAFNNKNNRNHRHHAMHPNSHAPPERSLSEEAAAAGPLVELDDKETVYDVAIVGAGPAGLSAALFAARAGLQVLVWGSSAGGSLLSETNELDNFPSFVKNNNNGGDNHGLSWLDVTRNQASSFGATFAAPAVQVQSLEAQTVKRSDNQDTSQVVFQLSTTSTTPSTSKVHAWSIILATGATPRRLGLPHEDQLWGRSLHSCALCDGHLYDDHDENNNDGKKTAVLVVGGGDAAMDAAILLARYASRVHLVHRRNEWSGNNQASQHVAETTENIQFWQPYVVDEWLVEEEQSQNQQQQPRANMKGVKLRNTEDESFKTLQVDGAFVMIGATPNTNFLKDSNDNNLVRLDADGLVHLTGPTTTTTPGIFAAGEIADRAYRQAITASAAGVEAAIDAERWLRETHGVTHQATVAKPAVQNATPKQAVVAPVKPPQPSAPVVAAAETNTDRKLDDDCDLTTEECITYVVNAHPVVVFSKNYCPFCRSVLELFQSLGVTKPFVIELTAANNMKKIQDRLKEMTGRRTVPNVFVGGNNTGGCEETTKLHREGQLMPLLKTAGALVDNGSETKKEACDLSEKACILQLIQQYPVLMFSLSWCPECRHSLEFLDSLGAKKPHIVDLDDYKPISKTIRFHMSNISGRRSVPNLFIGGEHFGGYQQTKKLHEEGKLLPELEKMGWLKSQTATK